MSMIMACAPRGTKDTNNRMEDNRPFDVIRCPEDEWSTLVKRDKSLNPFVALLGLRPQLDRVTKGTRCAFVN